MKKLIILILSLGAIGALGWYSMKLFKNKGKSDTELIEFAIGDVNSIDKVIITDKLGRTFEVQRKNGVWTDKKGGCVTQENAEFLLDAFKNIEFKGYLPDNSHKRYTNLMSAQNIKVEIFQNGEWTKTWYIGPPAQDHYGQIMLLDDSEQGKSDIPVLMKIKGLNGIIEPRFFADPKLWMCTNVFRLGVQDIKDVDVRFFDEPERSFSVKRSGLNFDVYQQGKPLSGVDTTMIFRYLNNYQKIHYNLANYELNDRQVDSLKRSKPFAMLSVTETSGKQTKLRCYRITNLKANVTAGMGEVLDMDRDKFWCELPNGEVVKCQYFVFNPLLLGNVYFPMDVSMLETVDGIQKK